MLVDGDWYTVHSNISGPSYDSKTVISGSGATIAEPTHVGEVEQYPGLILFALLPLFRCKRLMTEDWVATSFIKNKMVMGNSA